MQRIGRAARPSEAGRPLSEPRSIGPAVPFERSVGGIVVGKIAEIPGEQRRHREPSERGEDAADADPTPFRQAAARRIRVELSGNLCRCTGYRGIVNAVRSVVEARRQQPVVSMPKAGAALAAPLATFVPKDAEASPAAAAAAPTTAADEPRQGWTRFEESFVILQSPSTVWNTFEDIPAVTACLPCATLTEYDLHTVKGKMSVKLGPISASFAGSAGIERDDAALRGVIRGAGSDRGTGSRTKGEVVYRLQPEGDGRQTRVILSVEYSLQGALAQFSRSGIAQDLGRRLVADFAANLNACLTGKSLDRQSSTQLNVGRLLRLWVRDRLRRLIGPDRSK